MAADTSYGLDVPTEIIWDRDRAGSFIIHTPEIWLCLLVCLIKIHDPGSLKAGLAFQSRIQISNLSRQIKTLNGLCKLIVGIEEDRKSTRLNSSHVAISYAVFCL